MNAIKNRGRTIDGLVNPKNYPPFSKIPDRAAFDAAWVNRPDWILANMAHAAYHDKKYLEELFEGFGARIKFYQSKADRHGIVRGREAYLAIWEDKAILSFRGTEADDKLKLKLRENEKIARLTGVSIPSKFKISFIPTDIVDDLNFSPVTWQGKNGQSEVHRGFFKATEELWPEISGDLDNLEISSPDQVFVTGHSLGAAMAVIAGVKYPFNKIVTFGEPSVGNDLDNSIAPGCLHIRYVNGIDPVTKIVPESLYEHHGIQIEIEDADGPDVRFDHSIINYAVILESS